MPQTAHELGEVIKSFTGKLTKMPARSMKITINCKPARHIYPARYFGMTDPRDVVEDTILDLEERRESLLDYINEELPTLDISIYTYADLHNRACAMLRDVEHEIEQANAALREINDRIHRMQKEVFCGFGAEDII